MTEAYETNKLIYHEIMKLLRMRKTVTKKEVQTHLKKLITGNQRYRLTRIFSQMLQHNVVEIHGSKYRGHYRLLKSVDEEKTWKSLWKELKVYDRTRRKSKDLELPATPQAAPSTNNHLDQVAIALKAHQNAKEALRNLDKIQLVEELIRTRERAQTQTEQLREARIELGSLREDYDLAMKQNQELIQENASLHSKLNGRDDEKVS